MTTITGSSRLHRALRAAAPAALLAAALAAAPDAAAQWSEAHKLLASDGAAADELGWAVAIDGDVAVVSAFHEDGARGAAYVYRSDGASWIEAQKLTASDGEPADEFGFSVAVSGDVILVGAHFDDANRGAAYVFRRDGASWVEAQKLVASDGGANSRFGESVAIDGAVAIVGAREAEAAYAYRDDGGTWVEAQKLTAPDGAPGDLFGHAVSLRAGAAIVGAPLDDDDGADSGSAYVYRHDGLAWSLEQKLTASDAAAYDHLGWSVALDGDAAIAGLPGDDDRGAFSGSAYRFRFDGATWVEAQKLTASNGQSEDRFGQAVAVSGRVALVGAWRAPSGIAVGAVYAYRDAGAGWGEEQRLSASDGAVDDRFGRSVALDGDVAIVGAHRDDDRGADSGSAYVEVFSDFRFGDPQEVARLDEPTALGPSDFETGVLAGAVTADIWVTVIAPVEGEPGRLVVLLNDGTGTAFEPVATTVGVGPRNAAVRDFDGASGPDAAVANAGDDTVTILLNDGTGRGTFDDVSAVAVGTRPVAVGAGDLDGDGDRDVAVANEGDGTVSILLNDGGGGFALDRTIAVGAAPSDLILADFDGDGLGDLLVTNAGDDDVSILLNDGAGGFVREDLPVGNRPGEADPEDLDNDKDLDGVIRNADSGDVSLLLNDGAGGFDVIRLPVGGRPRSMTTGDLDLDGDPELLVVTDADAARPGVDRVIRVFRSELRETGRLLFIEVDQLAIDPFTAFVEVAPLDGDEFPDVVKIGVEGGGEGSGPVTVLLNRPPCPSDVNGSGGVDFADVLAVLSRWGPCGECPEDVNGDAVVNFADVLLLLSGWGDC